MPRNEPPIIVYIGFAQPDEWREWAGLYALHAARFEAAGGGTPCLVMSYRHATAALMERLAPAAVVMSGFARSFEQYTADELMPVAGWLTGATRTPVLALCGSHQLVGYVFNGEFGSGVQLADRPMRALRPDEPVTNPDYHPDFLMERGYYPLTLHGDDPLFAGCGAPPMVFESHYCEVKTLPPGFRLVASTPECRIQAMRHEERPLVSLQFHPEEHSDRFGDGRTILSNFMAEALGTRARAAGQDP